MEYKNNIHYLGQYTHTYIYIYIYIFIYVVKYMYCPKQWILVLYSRFIVVYIKITTSSYTNTS